MTIYFAPPGEPIDGDNWQELSMLDSDGLEFEKDRLGAWQGQEITVAAVDEVTIEITPEIRTGFSAGFTFTPKPEIATLLFGYDVYALQATVAEWLRRAAPMPRIPKAEIWEIQDGVNRRIIYMTHATHDSH